jgi:hypothetical protein
MTPAENPNDPERNLGLSFFEKKDIAPPMPVDNPANSVKPKASRMLLVSIDGVINHFSNCCSTIFLVFQNTHNNGSGYDQNDNDNEGD